MRNTAPTHSVRLFFKLLVAVMLISSCDQNKVSSPVRHKNIPENAQWGGGIDGGNWYSCRPSNKKWYYSCTIYNDSNGFVESEGQYKLQSQFWDKKQSKVVLQDIDSVTLVYDSYDGSRVKTLNSLVLIPITK